MLTRPSSSAAPLRAVDGAAQSAAAPPRCRVRRSHWSSSTLLVELSCSEHHPPQHALAVDPLQGQVPSTTTPIFVTDLPRQQLGRTSPLEHHFRLRLRSPARPSPYPPYHPLPCPSACSRVWSLLHPKPVEHLSSELDIDAHLLRREKHSFRVPRFAQARLSSRATAK